MLRKDEEPGSWPAIRLVAWLRKAIQRPSALIRSPEEPPLGAPRGAPAAWLTREIAPVARWYRKTEVMTGAWPGTRSAAELRKATELPSALIAGSPVPESPFPSMAGAPLRWLIRVRVPEGR